MANPETHWIISAFNSVPRELLVDTYELRNVSVARLRAALGLPSDKEDPDLLYIYPIQTHAQAAEFSALLGVKFDLEAHDYFLDASAEVGAAPHRSRVLRRVTVFEKAPTSQPIFEYELPREPDASLRASLGHPIDELGFHTRWRISTPEVANRLAPFLRAPLDLSAPRNYFIEHWDRQKTRPMVLAFPKGEPSGHRKALAKHELRGATKARLRSILGLSEDHPLAGIYPVKTRAQATALAPLLGQTLNLNARDYAVNYYVPRKSPRASM